MGSGQLVALAGGIFILPFFLFSPFAGQISDKYEKSQLIRFIKLLEIFIMIIAAIAFYFESYGILFIVLFLMGFQSSLFGPVKYSIIPELVGKNELVTGNAYVQSGTFSSILLGTIAGGVVTNTDAITSVVGGGLILFAALGYYTSRGIPKLDSANANLKINYNSLTEFASLFKLIRNTKALFNSVLAISWFWFFGAGILSILPIYGKDYLNVEGNVVTLFLAMFTVGVGTGSILCEKLSGKRVELGLVPIGSIGLTLFLVDLYFASLNWLPKPSLYSFNDFFANTSSIRILFDFFMMSVSGGIFIVPLYTLLQERSDIKSRARVIASNNIMNALFMVLSSVLVMGMYALKLTPPEMILAFAIMNLLVAIYIYTVVPEFTFRFYSWIFAHLLYKLNVKGIENVPEDGPVIIAGNHTSYIDWLLIYGVCKRPTRFVIYYKYFYVPVLKHFFKQAKLIPIAGRNENGRIMEKAFDSISSELKEGEVVCIFPEGNVTKTGNIASFKPGIKQILEKEQAIVVPFVLRGLWGSYFSKKHDKKFSFRRRPIEIEFLKPIDTENFRVDQLEAIVKEAYGNNE